MCSTYYHIGYFEAFLMNKILFYFFSYTMPEIRNITKKLKFNNNSKFICYIMMRFLQYFT